MSVTVDLSIAELKKVIADFIDMGHVENIVAMFKEDPALYALSGDLLRDERFMVRIGMAVLFEEMVVIRPNEIRLAIPALLPLLTEASPILRGESATLLGIIGDRTVCAELEPLIHDPDPQVAEIARDIFSSWSGQGDPHRDLSAALPTPFFE